MGEHNQNCQSGGKPPSHQLRGDEKQIKQLVNAKYLRYVEAGHPIKDAAVVSLSAQLNWKR